MPPLPEAYYGTITINGVPAPAGTQILASIKGVQKVAFTTTVVGVYGAAGTFDPKLIVSGEEYDVGETITFRVDGLQAEETAIYEPGESQVLALSFYSENIFDTGGEGTYPSISGIHKGTITPNRTIVVHKMYTYPCAGTGGHTEYVKIWNDTWPGKEAHWKGYVGDWHNITFDPAITLQANTTYNYKIRTGSYPQIIHKPEHTTLDGSFINCTAFTDANGKTYTDWIPAIRLE